jgi:hypothetical protein
MAMIPSAIGYRLGSGSNAAVTDLDGLNDWNGLNEIVQTVQNVQIVQDVFGESRKNEVWRR